MKRIIDNLKMFVWCIGLGAIMLVMRDKDWAELESIGNPYGRGKE